MRGRRQRCTGRTQDEIGAGVVHGIGSPLAERRPTDADLDRVRRALQDFRDGAAIRNATGNSDY